MAEHAMTAASKKKGEYLRVGGYLRDDLIREIDALGWEGADKARAEKIRNSLQLAAPHRGGFLFDVHDWDWEDYDFLRMLVDSVEEDMGHSGMSRGISLGNSPIGRQIRALKEKL
jgi:hypothetical protein